MAVCYKCYNVISVVVILQQTYKSIKKVTVKRFL